ncbi:MAG: hypothetical protein RR249_06040 [Tannerellaceae bacterium]
MGKSDELAEDIHKRIQEHIDNQYSDCRDTSETEQLISATLIPWSEPSPAN